MTIPEPLRNVRELADLDAQAITDAIKTLERVCDEWNRYCNRATTQANWDVGRTRRRAALLGDAAAILGGLLETP